MFVVEKAVPWHDTNHVQVSQNALDCMARLNYENPWYSSWDDSLQALQAVEVAIQNCMYHTT